MAGAKNFGHLIFILKYMKRLFLLILLIVTVCISCSLKKDKFSPDTYFDAAERDTVLVGILSHILLPPPYVNGIDRIKPKYHIYYYEQSIKFELDKLFREEKSDKYYFLVYRPGNKPGELRGVGGSFKLDSDFNFKYFREVFVTPILPQAEARKRSEFLFQEMQNNQIEQYLKMKTYVDWPNEISYYDTLSFEWKWRSDLVSPN